MHDFLNQKDIQRIGELVVAGPSVALQETFIRAICPDVVRTSNDTIFGRTRITDELFLFYYGIGNCDPRRSTFAWELVAPKMLGVILVFDWYVQDSFQAAQELIDRYSRQFEAKIIAAGDTETLKMPIPLRAFDAGFSIFPNVHCALWNSSQPASAKRVMRTLMDSIMGSR